MSPTYGRRLMPVVVDEIARNQPELPYASIPLSTNISDGFKNVTFSDIATATNYVAGWIDRTLGRSSNFDTIAYMGLGDLRYVVVFLAAVKCGYKVLLPSIRNSPWMNASLLEQTQCTHLLYVPEVETFVKPLLAEKPALQIHAVQPLESLIQLDTPHFPYEKEYETAKWDPILILHSSGSTREPRPIVMNHNAFAVADNDRNLPPAPGRVNQNWSLWDFPEKETWFSPFPAFHLAGFSSMIVVPIYYSNATLVLSPPTRPPSGHLVSEIMDHFRLKAIFCPPIIAEQLVQEPGGIEKCKFLNFLMFSGGPLSQAAGEALSKVTDVCQIYGSTETGMMQTLVPGRDDWAYLEWHPKVEAIMEHSVEGTHELVLKPSQTLQGVRNLDCNFPDVDVWHTKDLFRPHPTKEGLWKFHGRSDDIIVLSNGEKFNPVPSEVTIASHPLLSGALVIGQEYPQASLVLEPKDYGMDTIEVIEQVWPIVEKANKEAPAHAKITRNMIIVASKDKPFDRAGKGTVIRSSSGKQYEQEVAELYVKEAPATFQHVYLPESPDLAAVTEFVTKAVQTAFPGQTISEDDDFFVLGLDSLQTTEVISLVKAGIQNSSGDTQAWITAKFIYDHPTISTLSSALLTYIQSGQSASNAQSQSWEVRTPKLKRIIERYTQDLPARQDKTISTKLHVLLTGSTGSLGTQILVQILNDPKVSRVTCLDRSANAQERIVKSLSSWPTPPTLNLERVSFIQASYGQKDFGLDAQIYNNLKATVDVVIHNAWKVDFNQSVGSFEAVHIQGVRNFIDFAAACTLSARIIFVSSVSAIGYWTEIMTAQPMGRAPWLSDIRIVPELIPPTPAVAQPIGYAESKAIAEQILAQAAEESGIPVSIARVGQIAGPIDPNNGGRWNDHEWFALMLKTSMGLGTIPAEDLLEYVDWVPMEVVAKAVCELTSASLPSALQVYNIVNPTTRPWAELVTPIKRRLGIKRTISFPLWVEHLAANMDYPGSAPSLPALMILDFFKGLVKGNYFGTRKTSIATSAAEVACPSLKALGPIQEEWMMRWIDDWGLRDPWAV